MAEVLIRKRGTWMDKDDNGLTKYERFQLLIDNYRSGTLTPRQKWVVIQFLAKKMTRAQAETLMTNAGVPFDNFDSVADLYRKLQNQVENWATIPQARKDIILAWADDVIDAIPASVAIAYKDKMVLKYSSRGKIGDIVAIMEDGFFCEPGETTGKGWDHDAFYLIKIPGVNHENAQSYVGPVEVDDVIIHNNRWYVDLVAAPAGVRDTLQSEGQITVTWPQIQPYLVDKNG